MKVVKITVIDISLRKDLVEKYGNPDLSMSSAFLPA